MVLLATESTPLAWVFEQFVLLRRSRSALVDNALRRLWSEDEQLRWALVVNAYLDMRISLSKAVAEVVREYERGVLLRKIPQMDWQWLTVYALTADELSLYQTFLRKVSAGEDDQVWLLRAVFDVGQSPLIYLPRTFFLCYPTFL